jgi:hypothetical protein
MESKISTLATSAIAILFALLSVQGSDAGEKKDRVLLANGDQLTGEIKQLDRGSLRFKTDAMDTIEIDQEFVKRLVSSRRFEVETLAGDRHYGPLIDPVAEGMLCVAANGKLNDFELERIASIYPIESKLLKRLDGGVSLGFSVTASSDISQFNLNSNVKYRQEKYNMSGSFSWITTDQESGRTSRGDLTASSATRVGRRWFTAGVASLQRNDELGIDSRLLFGAGFGRYLTTPHSQTAVALGLATNRENTDDDERSGWNWEGVLRADQEIFMNRPREISLTATLSLFAGITQSSRFRSEFSVQYQHEVVSDFTLGLRAYSSTDSEPPPDSADSDYGVLATVGWTF